MAYERAGRLTVAVTLLIGSAAAIPPAEGQEPVPPADSPGPGSAFVDGSTIRVTHDERVRVNVRCVVSEVPCRGSLRVLTRRPISPGNGRARRIVTIADGPYGEIAPGQARTVTLKLESDAVARIRKVLDHARHVADVRAGQKRAAHLPLAPRDRGQQCCALTSAVLLAAECRAKASRAAIAAAHALGE